MEKKVKLSYILKPIYFVLFAILLEIINFAWLGFTVTGNLNLVQILPTYFFLDLGVWLIAASIMFVANRNWVANVAMYFIIGLQVLLNIINATIFKVFGDIFSFDMMKLCEEAAEAFKFEFIDFWSIIVNLLVLGGLITLQVLLDKKLKKECELTKLNKRALLILVFFVTFGVGLSSYGFQTMTFKTSSYEERVFKSDDYLWDNMQFKLESYKKFGTFGFYLKSLGNVIYKNDEYNDEIEADLIKKLDEGQVSADVSAPLYGDNLIVIMLESFEWFAIDPFNTPTLWKIRTQTGVAMENFYSKNKTNVSEDIGIIGNMPWNVSIDYLAKEDLLNTPYTLPSLFKSRGYTANFFHCYKKTIYDRALINSAMGFDKVYELKDADLENKSTKFNQWNLDSDYMNALVDEFMPTDKNFFSFMTTITTHGTYNTTNSRFAEYYKTYDENLPAYKEWLKNNTSYIYPQNKNLEKYYRQYKCAAMDTDRLVSEILRNLEERGLDRNTTLVMYADHNCYYEDVYFQIKGTKKEDYFDLYNYNVPFMIYSKKLAPEQRTDFVNTYDIFPTICELFGLPYNKALTHGYNLFSSEIENSTMISYLSGAFNNDFYSLNIVDVHAANDASQADLEKFRRNASLFYEKQYDIELIYKHGLARNRQY